MICLECNTYIYKKKLDGILVRECPHRQGIWLDNSEIPKLEMKFFFKPKLSEVRGIINNQNCKKCHGDIEIAKTQYDRKSVEFKKCTDCKSISFDHENIGKLDNLGLEVNKYFNDKTLDKLNRRSKRCEKLTRLYRTEFPVSKNAVESRNHFIGKVYFLFALSLVVAFIGASFGLAIGLTYRFYLFLSLAELVMIVLTLNFRRAKVT